MHIKNKIGLIISLLMLLILAGCASMNPATLGISNTQWESYSSQQKKEIIQNYKEVQKQSVETAIGDLNNRLNVTIQNGAANIPPSTKPVAFKPINFELAMGQCNIPVKVVALNDSKPETTLKACYKNHILYLDPSRYDVTKVNGSIQLPYQPVWKRGFTYPGVNSSGYVKFYNVDVTVKIVAGE